MNIASSDSAPPAVEMARAVAELFVLLTLSHKPLEEEDLNLFEMLRDELAASSAFYARILSVLGRRHFIEALGQLHGSISMEAACHKSARDLGKTLSTLPIEEKSLLCALTHEHFCEQDNPLFLSFYSTLTA